jgi:uncharacterized protein (TIGR00290 family)
MKERVVVGWSGGKDSAMALHEIKKDPNIEIASLLTTVTEGYERISMHGVRRDLLVEQAKSLGYPLEEIPIPQTCSNEIHEERMRASLEKHKREGVAAAVFGDLFLQDIRSYREERMGRIGMRCLFPVWDRPTHEFAREFIALGFRAIIVCADTQAIGSEFAGREYDIDFLKDLPADADPCGENGEFHSFVYDGPIFSTPISVQRGEKALRDNRFYYCDLLAGA